ncbi:UNVERIFIED_CONTAM: hypothetical protein Sradi_1587900 [Sesamum radiatum]|uniref:Uncharacterized protein n=1 Tax=Sesamum radiatum TaxID=300843 RepID=A0AAW2UAC0_SESRA
MLEYFLRVARNLWNLNANREGLPMVGGDSRSIKIWHDRWVPREYTFKVISPPNILDKHATISQLISDSGREWKEDLVREIFHPNQANTNLSMPIGRGTMDTLIYHKSKKGKFSIRAVYNMACDVSRIDFGGPSRMDPNRDLEFILKAKVPVMVKLFGCKKLAEGESEDSLQLIDKTRQYFATFKEANEKQAKSSGVSQNAEWNPPLTGKIKINFDGATFKDPIGAGTGLIAKDHNGNCGAWNHKFATSINEASMLKLGTSNVSRNGN